MVRWGFVGERGRSAVNWFGRAVNRFRFGGWTVDGTRRWAVDRFRFATGG
jgi:hypothetical protein